ncbi:VOC family protein [Paenibacillus sp. S150]|uniref:VOC family protein n=1 Tax=Paenibacillus sp. S150 TaxID=2749826 RepID=UPI001C5740D7|nr:VOC family protein [Paenibacillus sp. S150]MBW4080492.1 VOC family protein [Paenibacillus sp. S150]
MTNAQPGISTFLMFEGQAEEAMNFYVSLFEHSEVISIQRYGAGEAGAEGTVMQAAFTIKGASFMCIDSYVKHGFSFTPAISLYVNCADEAELDAVYEQLSQGGNVLMPLGEYPFSRKFGWVADRYGVTWQLNLPNPE